MYVVRVALFAVRVKPGLTCWNSVSQQLARQDGEPSFARGPLRGRRDQAQRIHYSAGPVHPSVVLVDRQRDCEQGSAERTTTGGAPLKRSP